MQGKLQMIKLQVYQDTIVNHWTPFRGYGVVITFGYTSGTAECSIPAIYETQNEALEVARKVRDIIHSADPEQVYIEAGFDDLHQRMEF